MGVSSYTGNTVEEKLQAIMLRVVEDGFKATPVSYQHCMTVTGGVSGHQLSSLQQVHEIHKSNFSHDSEW